MKIDLSRKITGYAKKILIIILIIHISILSIGNSGSTYAWTWGQSTEAQQEDIRNYARLLMQYTDNGPIFGDKTNWKNVDISGLNADNIRDRSQTELTVFYLIDYAVTQGVKYTGADLSQVWDTYYRNVYSQLDQMNLEQLADNMQKVVTAAVQEDYEDYVEEPAEVIEKDDTNNFLLEVLDGIAGVLFIGFKIIPIIIGGALEMIMNISSGEKITIYSVIFNEVGLTNINFFEEATRK